MLYGVISFICWVAVVALTAAFLLSLATKWNFIEWMQVHAPNDFIAKLVNCKFCLSWWTSIIISLILCIATGHWILLLAPVCTTIITRELW